MDKLEQYELNAECNTVEIYRDDFGDNVDAWEYITRKVGIADSDIGEIASIEIKIDTIKINTDYGLRIICSED